MEGMSVCQRGHVYVVHALVGPQGHLTHVYMEPGSTNKKCDGRFMMLLKGHNSHQVSLIISDSSVPLFHTIPGTWFYYDHVGA